MLKISVPSSTPCVVCYVISTMLVTN